MAALVVLVAMLAMVGGSDATWCVCRSDVSSSAIQKTLDYACGAGADCNPIHQNGVCYYPNTVLAHCSYAANSSYQTKGQVQTACDFAGTAIISSTDPSGSGCTYPATPSAAATSTTPTGTTTTRITTIGTTPTTPSTTTNPGSTTPTTFTPTTGTGGVLGGLGPTGNSISTDGNTGRIRPHKK